MKVTYQDIKTGEFEIGLSKLIGKPIKEIHGLLTHEFGDVTFEMTRIEFEDGSELGCEGEHDLPYLVEYRMYQQPNFDDETLNRLYKEQEDDN